MTLEHLWLADFRCFEILDVVPDPGVTVLLGQNGSGKTSVLEAIGWLATTRSFRGAHRDAIIRKGADRGIVRGELLSSGRRVLIEGELPVGRTARIMVNRQATRRQSDLGEVLKVSVFSPDDLSLVQGGPAYRRAFLDDNLVMGDVVMEKAVAEVERVLKHRAALLRQAQPKTRGDARSSRLRTSVPAADAGEPSVDSSFSVWDERLAASGTRLTEARETFIEALNDPVADAYSYLAGRPSELNLTYKRSWEGSLLDALVSGRDEDLRTQSTGRGPHRDELVVMLEGMPVRTNASQGEQRCAALALRLAAHEVATEKFGEPPILLLDDVFSELDAHRAELLAKRLPTGQVLLATAVEPPSALSGSVIDIADSRTGQFATNRAVDE